MLKGFTRDFALELTEIREMFELRSAQAFAACRRTTRSGPISIALEAEHHASWRDIDTRYNEFSELDERFHRLIHRASHNRFIVDFYDVIAMIFHYHYQWNKAQKARNKVALEEHLAYIAALKSRDPARCRRRLPRASEVGARHAAATSIPESLSGLRFTDAKRIGPERKRRATGPADSGHL